MDDDHGRTVINHDEWGRHQQMMIVDLDNIMDLRHVKQSVRCVRKREERRERRESERKERGEKRGEREARKRIQLVSQTKGLMRVCTHYIPQYQV